VEERKPAGPDPQDDDEDPGEAIVTADDTGLIAQQELINEFEERPLQIHVLSKR
jgi:hypothetical protein